jgi:ribosomal protein L37AE/L43A
MSIWTCPKCGRRFPVTPENRVAAELHAKLCAGEET